MSVRTAILPLAALLASCAANPPPLVDDVAAEPAPAASVAAKPFKPVISQAAARAMLAANRSRLWKDPDSVREAKIGDAYECLNQDGTTCFCIEANGRNSYGGFTGLHMSQARFTTGKNFETVDEMYAPEHCGRMVPFPEMNGRQAR